MLTNAARKALWDKKAGSFQAIAEGAGVTRNHVRLVLLGQRRSPKVEKVIDQFLGEATFPPRVFVRKPRKSGEAA